MTSPAERVAAAAAGVLERCLSRRSLFTRAAVVGSAVATGGLDFVLRPGTAYASICGDSHTCSSGWTAMCCTINHGVNQCPPGSFAGGWWKAEGASLCGGKARYYVDCQGECTSCGCHGGQHFCAEKCWNCKKHCAHGSCDERRVCHNVFRYGQCDRDRHCSGPVLCRAISCTPPWKWANCSTASATDNFTVSHTAPCLPGWGEIQQRYTHLGSEGSPLGATVGAMHNTKHGEIQHYTHGRMYRTAHTDPKYLTGHVLSRYRELGELSSPLGAPTSDVGPTADHHGTRARFDQGGIYQRGAKTAYGIWGAVDRRWRDLGGVTGSLAYPVADQARTRSATGQVARFEGGLIMWADGLAAHFMLSVLAAKYDSLGVERDLGYPVADQAAVADSQHLTGIEVRCDRGAVIAVTGLSAFGVWGPIYAAWQADGGVAGALGFPTSDVTDVTLSDGPGQQCTFNDGTAVYDATTGHVTITPS
jgi:LGFP repeat